MILNKHIINWLINVIHFNRNLPLCASMCGSILKNLLKRLFQAVLMLPTGLFFIYPQ